MSTKFELSSYDRKSWFINVICFFSPVVMYIAYKVSIMQTIDWKVVYLTSAGLLLNLLKKWYKDNGVDPVIPTPEVV